MHLATKTPAKVNLSLLIGPRRADGYHELFSVFAPIDLFDSLEFDLVARPHGAGCGALRVDCEVASGEDNLATRALRVLEKSGGWAFEGRVRIGKGIPVGAGLGGGSSDGAAALRAGAQAIAAAGGTPPDEGQLRSLARELGADVPFFLRPEPSVAKGVGDALEPLGLPAVPLVLMFQAEQLSTAAVYGEFDRLAGDLPGTPRPAPVSDHGRTCAKAAPGFEEAAAGLEARWREVSREWSAGRLRTDQVPSAVAELLKNDLEEASFRLLFGLRENKDVLLEAGALGAVMSGSGPTLLGVCQTRSRADEVAERLRLSGYRARAAEGGVFP